MNEINSYKNYKCAPSKKFTDGSCFSLEALQLIGKEYNKKNNDKIEIVYDKTLMVEQLHKKLSNICSSQTCWLKLDIVMRLDNEDINDDTFRPSGPKSKYEWLNTTHINEVVEQYHKIDENFLFLGAVPYDFEELSILELSELNFEKLENENKTKIGMVINLDEHHKQGSHWVALYTDLKKNQIYFFDSFAKPPRKRIKKYINKIVNYLYKKENNKVINVGHILSHISKLPNTKQEIYINKLKDKIKNFDIRYNQIRHQFDNSECGVYSINFILRLVKGESFEEITNNITLDEKMNSCRETYFR